MRVMLWPRRSFWRSAQYFAKRVLRLSATPHAVALGVALGVFASFLPFLGLHLVLAIVLAWLMAGNMVAAALGTAIGNPLTFPLIWGSTYEVGRLILYGRSGHLDALSLGAALRQFSFADLWHPVLKPMTVGAVPLGLAFAVVFYVLTRWATAAFRRRRERRFAEKLHRKASAHAGATAPARKSEPIFGKHDA